MSIYIQYIIVISVAFITFLLRYTPFILEKQLQKYNFIRSLEIYLPGSIMLILVIYCQKDINIYNFPYGLKEIISILAVIILHLKYRNALLSIVAGTVVFMILQN